MREVKFMAWDKEEKRMWLVDDIHLAERTADIYLYEPNPLKENRLERISNCRFRYPNRIILIQYTGREDKHENEIYFTDIVRTTRSYDYGFLPKGSIAEVVWDEKECCVKLRSQGEHRLTANKQVEVIGNALANPELLEVENEPDKT